MVNNERPDRRAFADSSHTHPRAPPFPTVAILIPRSNRSQLSPYSSLGPAVPRRSQASHDPDWKRIRSNENVPTKRIGCRSNEKKLTIAEFGRSVFFAALSLGSYTSDFSPRPQSAAFFIVSNPYYWLYPK